MSKKDNERIPIDQPIPDLQTAWDDGVYAYVGTRVEEFIKQQIQSIIANSNGKIGHCRTYSDGTTMNIRFFADANKADEYDSTHSSALVLCDIQVPIGGGGGGGSSNIPTLNCRQQVGFPLEVVRGAECKARFSYKSYYGNDETDVDTIPGSMSVKINGNSIDRLYKNDLRSGDIREVDIKDYLTESTNSVEVEFRNSFGGSRTFTYTIKVLSLEVYFANEADEAVPRSGSFDLRVGLRGMAANVQLKLDSSLYLTADMAANSLHDFNIDGGNVLRAGVHEIRVVAINDRTGSTIQSQEIRRRFIKIGATALVIGRNAPTSASLYETIQVPYFFYVSGYENQTATINVNISLKVGNTTIKTEMQTVSITNGASGMQTWECFLTDSRLSDRTARIEISLGGTTSDYIDIPIRSAVVTLQPASQCQVLFDAAGKTNADSDAQNWQSSYSGSVTCKMTHSDNFRFKADGSTGFGSNRFRVGAGRYIDFVRQGSMNFFDEDFGPNSSSKSGKTFEFIFRAVNIADVNALIIRCFNSNIGFNIYANRATFGNGSSFIETRFLEGERIHLVFTVDGQTTECVNRLIGQDPEISRKNLARIYVNGVMTRIMEVPASNSWRQLSPQNIRVGSDDCAVDLEAMLVYNKPLSDAEVIANYAYYAQTLAEKISIARRNDILDDNSGEVSFTKVRAALPNTPYKIWDLPTMPVDKKNYVTSSTEFVNPLYDGNPLYTCASFTCLNHGIALDGTSSLTYPAPYKNFADKYSGEHVQWTVRIDGTDITITSYSISEGIAPAETEFVDKVNFASSEGIGNILAMNAYHNILQRYAQSEGTNVLTPQQKAQYSLNDHKFYARMSLSGFPIIGYLKKTALNGSAKTEFLSLFNFINNKYSKSIFGIGAGDNSEVWEVEDNMNFFMERLSEGTWDTSGSTAKWVSRASELYYARVPKKSGDRDYGKANSQSTVSAARSEQSALIAFHNWVQSCNPTVANRYKLQYGNYQRLTPAVQIGDVTYYDDDPDYRIAKFRAEAANWMSVESACFYFNFCHYFLGIDSLDKNMSIMFTTVSGKANKIAYFALRDTDTICEFNNHGVLALQPYHEWNDAYNSSTDTTATIVGEEIEHTADGNRFTLVCKDAQGNRVNANAVFNARQSGLWDCLVAAFPNEVSSSYNAMKGAGLNRESLMALYDEFRNQWCEMLYNVDGMGYANTGKLEMAYGDKREHFKRFFRYRDIYLSSKYGGTEDSFAMRLYGSVSGLAVRYSVPIYAAVGWGTNTRAARQRLIHPGEAAYFPGPNGSVEDLTTTVYYARYITSLKAYTDTGSSIVESGLQNLSSAININGIPEDMLYLEELELDYTGKQRNDVQGNDIAKVGNSVALKRLVLRNIGSDMDASFNIKSEQIELIDLRDTYASGLIVEATDSLTSIKLGSHIQTLSLKDLGALQTLELQGVSELTSLTIVDCPTLRNIAKDLVTSVLNNSQSGLKSLELEGIEWTGFPIAQLEKLAAIPEGRITGTITVTGNVNFELKRKLIERFGDIDSENAPLKIVYTKFNTLSEVQVFGDLSAKIVGNYRLNCIGVPASANNFTKIEWEMDANGYGTIDKNSGVVTVTRVSTEAEGVSAEVRCKVTKTDGSEVVGRATFLFYDRTAQVGDYVYADGSYSNIYNPTKTVVGICFYTNPENRSQRLCMKPSNLTYSATDAWVFGISGRTFPDITLHDDPTYNVYYTTLLDNVSQSGLSTNYITRETYYENGLSKDADGFSIFPTNTGVAQLGFKRLDNDFCGLSGGAEVPYGLINTLAIIAHRDHIISDTEIAFPPPEEGNSLKSKLGDLYEKMTAIALSKGENFKQYYFPAASVCNAYEPRELNEGEVLADCFKEGNWFLPSMGEMARIYWWDQIDEGGVFDNAKSKGKYTTIKLPGNANSPTWVSTNVYYNNTKWAVNFKGGNIHSSNPAESSFYIRPICAF